jgi:dihydrofolate synthase/folylpolyglutamate synthase
VVHVSGTNGKGSVIADLAAILGAAGYRSHVYTSPHLIRFAERIRLADRPIDEDHLAAVLSACERSNGDAPITFFEITTAAAFVAFAEHPADVLLLETGLGGRLDATNVIERPLVTAITPVAMDHMHYLGDDLATIAGEKAGILKPEVAAVIARQPPEAARAIAEQARRVGAPMRIWGRDWRIVSEGGAMVYSAGRRRLELPLPALAGEHQVANAGMAIACLEAMDGFEVAPEAMGRGLITVEWPGRLQRLGSGPSSRLLPPGAELWLDGGHNPGAGEALAATLAKWVEDERAAGATPPALYLVVGMLNSKRAADFLAPLAPLAAAAFGIAIPDESASLSAAEVTAGARAAGLAADPAESLDGALAAIATECAGTTATTASGPPRVLICGSLYLAGKVLEREGLEVLTPPVGTSRAPAA